MSCTPPVQFNDVSALIPNVVTQNNNALEILNTVEAEVDSVAAAFETASSTYRKEMLTLNELLTQKLLRLDAMKDLAPDMREKRKATPHSNSENSGYLGCHRTCPTRCTG